MRYLLALLILGPAIAPTATSQIRPDALRAHMRFLADDLLEGREAGTRGYDLAAAYVAAQFEAYGLEPAGASGTFLQPVPLRTAFVDSEASRLSLIRGGVSQALVLGRDFVPSPDEQHRTAEVRAPVVFVGFGVSAPQRGYDDYANLDVKGKVVVIAGGAPASLPSEERAYHSGLRVKRENAAAHGAVAILGFVLPEDEARYSWSQIVANLAEGKSAWLREDGTPEGASAAVRGVATLSRTGVAALLAGSGRSFEQLVAGLEAGKSQSFAMGVEAALTVVSQARDGVSPNVLGLLRGSDPRLAAEAVVLSAHLDHLGIGPAVDGDTIRNGAYDNASGVANLLETARALSRLSPHPRRSILFAAVTAEEKGLLGSDYLAAHPPLPMVANVNMDMSLSLFTAADVVAYGSEHSSLGEIVAEAAAAAGLTLSPDPHPRQTIFIRSDQYCFVRRGIPAVMLMAGTRSRDPKVDGPARFVEWLRTYYHSPKDDMAQPIDFASAARIAEVNLSIARRLADARERPAWKPGDFFGKLFAGAPQ